VPTGELIIGLMSGTSVDGIDATLVEFQSQRQLKVLNTLFVPFDDELKLRINQLAQSKSGLDMSEANLIDTELATHYAHACEQLIKQSGKSSSDIAAIANHGQTVRHEPDATPPFSVQLGQTQRIADLSGITTIGQFRQADLALGGQGAPLMPAFHLNVFGRKDPNALILNIGGIANLTQLSKVADKGEAIGFDTGPGNTLLDQWIKKCKGSSYDHDGEWAASGTVIEALLNDLLKEPYFCAAFPKSTGPDHFNLGWLEQFAVRLDYSQQDIQATLLQLTISTVSNSINKLGADHSNLYVCGGGAHNGAMMSALAEALPNLSVQVVDALGIPADWVESVGFAWLGYCHLHGFTSNLPSVTGASRAVVLGECCQPCQDSTG
jgi:anhydro-N-acetylmuramic acid kinase